MKEFLTGLGLLGVVYIPLRLLETQPAILFILYATATSYAMGYLAIQKESNEQEKD